MAPTFGANTSAFGAKPAFGGFGANSGSSLFGGGAGTQQPSTASNMFGATQQNQTPQNPSPFGSFGQTSQAQASQPQPNTNPFGQPQQQQPQGTSLFGAAAQTAQPTTSLFGQPAQQQQQQQPSSSIFGQPSSGSSLFGNQPQQQQPAAGSSFFGQPSQSTFGKPANPQPQQSQGLFGGGANNNFAGSTANTAAPQAQLPFSKTSKFNDLPDEVKKIFEQIDSHIQGRVHIANDLKNRQLGEEIEKTSTLIRSVYHRTQDVSQTLEQDARMTDHLRAKLDQSVQDTIAATRIVEGFRNQQVSGMYLKNYASFPLEFFTRVANDLKEKLEWFKSAVEQIERKLVLSASRPQYTPQAITSTLQNQHRTFIRLANKTAELDAELEEMKGAYREIYRMKTGSKRDPFEGGISVLDIS